MFSLIKQNPPSIKACVEYCAPHWVVLIQNPGAKDWTALRSTTKTVRIPNEFGDVVKQYPAIETFPSKAEASKWISQNIPGVETASRKHSEIEKFLMRAKSPVSAGAGSSEILA